MQICKHHSFPQKLPNISSKEIPLKYLLEMKRGFPGTVGVTTDCACRKNPRQEQKVRKTHQALEVN
jgi:hypothetical protein